jgi:hypothetical protein
LLIGSADGAHLSVEPFRREFPDAYDVWDGNTLCTAIRIVVGGFRADYEAQLRTEDFVKLRAALRELYEHLDGTASFETMEGWLRLQIRGDGRGHFTAECVALDQPGTGNCLTFTLELDQTDLPAMVRALEAIERAFPTRGAPGGS